MLQRQCGELISLVGSLMALGRCGLAYVGFRLTHWTPATYCLQDRSGGRFCLHTRVCRCVSTPTKGSLRVPDCSPPQCCRFFEALEQRHKAQVCVEDISDILEDHAENHFHPYIAYCSNEVYQQRTLQKLS